METIFRPPFVQFCFLFRQQLLQQLSCRCRVGFAFHFFHDLADQESEDFCLSGFVLFYRARIVFQNFSRGFFQKAGVVYGFQSVFLDVCFRIDILCKNLLKYLFRHLVVDRSGFCQFDQGCQMLR